MAAGLAVAASCRLQRLGVPGLPLGSMGECRGRHGATADSQHPGSGQAPDLTQEGTRSCHVLGHLMKVFFFHNNDAPQPPVTVLRAKHLPAGGAAPGD